MQVWAIGMDDLNLDRRLQRSGKAWVVVLRGVKGIEDTNFLACFPSACLSLFLPTDRCNGSTCHKRSGMLAPFPPSGDYPIQFRAICPTQIDHLLRDIRSVRQASSAFSAHSHTVLRANG